MYLQGFYINHIKFWKNFVVPVEVIYKTKMRKKYEENVRKVSRTKHKRNMQCYVVYAHRLEDLAKLAKLEALPVFLMPVKHID